MDVQKCKYGHYYDKSWDECPICRAEGRLEESDAFSFDTLGDTLVLCKNGHFYNVGLDACPICGQGPKIYSAEEKASPVSAVNSETMEAQKCKYGHYYDKALGECPVCRVEGRLPPVPGAESPASSVIVCGWAPYVDPENGVEEGVAFRIEKGGDDEIFYYLDDDNWPWQPEKHISLIRHYSSGISDLKVKWYVSADTWSWQDEGQSVLFFKLDPDAVKGTMLLRNDAGAIDGLYTSDIGRYIFVLPRFGEFDCEIGVIRNGKRVPLLKHGFCMK